MSDERYTVILGDRRYAIHRKWAKLPAGESFGFLSDLMVDREGRVHVAQRGTDRPVLVFDRDGRLAGAWGEGVLAEPHYINAASDGSILVADRDALDGAAAVWHAVAEEEGRLGDSGRVLVRPSGTEALVRVMVEAETEETARATADRLAAVVAGELG